MTARHSRHARHVLRVLSLAGALGLWQLLTALDVNLWLRFEQFPTVTDVAREFGERIGSGSYWQDLTDSLTRIVTGFALAAVAGVAVGTATRPPASASTTTPAPPCPVCTRPGTWPASRTTT